MGTEDAADVLINFLHPEVTADLVEFINVPLSTPVMKDKVSCPGQPVLPNYSTYGYSYKRYESIQGQILDEKHFEYIHEHLDIHLLVTEPDDFP